VFSQGSWEPNSLPFKNGHAVMRLRLRYGLID